MLENTGDGTRISNSGHGSLRKTCSEFFRTLRIDVKNLSRRLQGVGKTELHRGLDETVLPNLPPLDKIEIMENLVETREDKFAKCYFEWVKSERSGDVCKFSNFVEEGGVEYTVFTDKTRIRTDLIGDIVLMHQYENEILGDAMKVEPTVSTVLQHVRAEQHREAPRKISEPTKIQDPVVSILEKTRKRNEKITLTLTLKIPSPELYTVIRENFDNVDEILLDSVMTQVQEKSLRDAVKRELQNIYFPKKKKA